MLNENFFNKKDLQLMKLKRTIEAFKKYDAERKQYILKLQEEMENLGEQVCTLKATLSKDVKEVQEEYEQKIKILKSTTAGQSRKIDKLLKTVELMQNPDMLARVEKVLKDRTSLQLNQELQVLRKQVKNLRKANDELVARIVELEKQINFNKPKQ